ncbi:MAG: molecular chaperone HtpG [Bacilli bacterium]|nr:molecular chaperone HtpG [Bacilli bacterium]
MKKEFKAESKKLLDLMINSIYTNKDIFLRELISNSSDAIDKLYYKSLTDKDIDMSRDDFKIKIDLDKKKRTLTITDNGIGMNKEELEENLGTIAKSGSSLFKEKVNENKDINIIGQFGVGFYSAFMVADCVAVCSKAYGSDKAYEWKSKGSDGYQIKEVEKDEYGTTITLSIKDNNDNENFDEYLDDYKIKSIIKKYSDYITYPIVMNVEKVEKDDDGKENRTQSLETVNSMIPLWKKNKSELEDSDYQQFYHDKFFDYEDSLKTIHTSVEGRCSYTTLLYIPSHAPYDFYTKDYEKGLELYSNGVMIMENCKELLPDYYSFVKGLVDTSDLSLNISRELLQQDKNLNLIATNIEKKIKKELQVMLDDERDKYETFYKAFGMQLKFGIYNSYGMKRDDLQDLLLFYSSKEKKLVTLKEYVSRIGDSDKIYYAAGDSIDKVDMLPQVEKVKEKGYEILYFTDYIDEFVIQMMPDYDGKKFVNVSTGNLDLDSEDEKKKLEEENKEYKDMFTLMSDDLGDSVSSVRFTHRLKNHPVCLTTKGNVTLEMEKVINAMPTDEKVKAEVIMEINSDHDISKKLKTLYKEDKEELKKYTKILYAQARLIEGLPIENPTELSNIMCDIMSK